MLIVVYISRPFWSEMLTRSIHKWSIWWWYMVYWNPSPAGKIDSDHIFIWVTVKMVEDYFSIPGVFLSQMPLKPCKAIGPTPKAITWDCTFTEPAILMREIQPVVPCFLQLPNHLVSNSLALFLSFFLSFVTSFFLSFFSPSLLCLSRFLSLALSLSLTLSFLWQICF